MPPANSPTVRSQPMNARFPPARDPELDLFSEIDGSPPVPRQTADASTDEQAADDDNVSFLRTTLPRFAQYDSDEADASRSSVPTAGWQQQHQQQFRSDMDNLLLDPRITQSERETVRRLRRYVLDNGRPLSPASSSPRASRGAPSLRSRAENRYENYQGWAPGSTENDVVDQPMSMMDLRALARGGSRRAGTDGESVSRPYSRALLQPMRHMINSRELDHDRDRESRQDRPLRSYAGDMDWEPQPQAQLQQPQQRMGMFTADGSRDLDNRDASLRTTALLQSVRRHARFSPRTFPTTQQDTNLSTGIASLGHASRSPLDSERRQNNTITPSFGAHSPFRDDPPTMPMNPSIARIPLSIPGRGSITLGRYARLRHQRTGNNNNGGGASASTLAAGDSTNNSYNHVYHHHHHHHHYHHGTHPHPSTLSEGSKWLEEAIKYLERLRSCDPRRSSDEWMQLVEAGGFAPGHMFQHQDQRSDFVVDTSAISPPPPSSWLRAGSTFSGSQKSTDRMPLSIPHAPAPSSGGAETRQLEHGRRRRRPLDNGYATSSSGSRLDELATASNRTGRRGTPQGQWMASAMPRAAESLAIGSQGAEVGVSESAAAIEGENEFISTRSGGLSGINRASEESWPVKVTITSVDYDKMRLTGTMEAFDVPNKTCPSQRTTIATYLEGEIIDFRRFTLETTSFNATSVVDSTYWRKLEPFRSLSDSEIVQNLLSAKWLCDELSQKYVLMRWKEQCFITPSDAQVHLTISGFYYVSLRRDDGRLEGLYYDPTSTPYQHLVLKAESRAFPSYDFQPPMLHTK